MAQIKFDIQGTIPMLAQKDENSCWATVITMMLSWKQNKSLSIDDAITSLGGDFKQILDDGNGLSSDKVQALATATGMTIENQRCESAESLYNLLKIYGALCVLNTNASNSNSTALVQARIITGIDGDTLASGTILKIIDPNQGKSYDESFETFAATYESMTEANGWSIQLMHYPPIQVSTNTLTDPKHPLVAQDKANDGWLAATTMVKSYNESTSFQLTDLLSSLDANYTQAYNDDLQLSVNDLNSLIDTLALSPFPQASFTAATMSAILDKTPILAVILPSDMSVVIHAVVITGINADGDLQINDPLPVNTGHVYSMSFSDFESKFETSVCLEDNISNNNFTSQLYIFPDRTDYSAGSCSYDLKTPIYLSRRPTHSVPTLENNDQLSRVYPLEEGKDMPFNTSNDAATKIAKITEIIEFLKVSDENHLRYKKDGDTFCNIYAYDFGYLMGYKINKFFIPHVWWDAEAVKKLESGEAVIPELFNKKTKSVEELNANRLFDWFENFGGNFGWVKQNDMDAAQKSVNESGDIGVIVAKNANGPGHITIVIPEKSVPAGDNTTAVRDEDDKVTNPLQSQAGASNFEYGHSTINNKPWFEAFEYNCYIQASN
jgi:Papain-like cysteine protease AvrRpt2